MKKKPVLINGVSLRSQLTGVGYYTLELFTALARHRKSAVLGPDIGEASQLHLFLGNNYRLNWTGSSMAPTPGVTSHRMGLKGYLRQKLTAIPWLRKQVRARQTRRFLQFSRSCKALEQQGTCSMIYHEPNFIAFPFEGATVVTAHDFSFVRHPETHPAERVRYMSAHILDSLERADRIVLVSDFVKAELRALFGSSAVDKSRVIPNGVSERFRPRCAQEVHPVLYRYGLGFRGFLLSVGTLEPRKNLIHLIQAYTQLPAAVKAKYPLVLAGPKGWHLPALEQQLYKLRHEPIRWLGYLEPAELEALYASARAFAYLSIYEGFGLPVLESMASGTPVLVSQAGALTELVADTGLITSPYDLDATREALETRLLDETLWEHHRSIGLMRAQQLSWTRAASMLEQIYDELP